MKKKKRIYNLDFISKQEYFALFQWKPGLILRRVATECWGDEFHIYYQSHPVLLTAYVQKGCGFLTRNKVCTKIEKGMVFSFGVEEECEFKVEEEDGLTLLIVEFHPQLIKSLIDLLPGRGKFVVKADLEQEYLHVVNAIQNNSRESYQISVLYAEIILRKLIDEFGESREGFSPASNLFHKCKNYMDNNFVSIRSASEVAIKFDIHPVQLIRLFKRYQNQTPFAYLQSIRMYRAAELLLSTDLLIKEVAGHLNETDQYTFSKTFKKVLGCSPKDYRARNISVSDKIESSGEKL